MRDVGVRASSGRPHAAGRAATLLTHLVLIAVCVAIGLPFFWMVTTSIKGPTEVQIFPPVWWPETPRFENFVDAWEAAPFGRFYVNSIITARARGVVLEMLDRGALGLRLRPHPVPLPRAAVRRHARGHDDPRPGGADPELRHAQAPGVDQHVRRHRHPPRLERVRGLPAAPGDPLDAGRTLRRGPHRRPRSPALHAEHRAAAGAAGRGDPDAVPLHLQVERATCGRSSSPTPRTCAPCPSGCPW